MKRLANPMTVCYRMIISSLLVAYIAVNLNVIVNIETFSFTTTTPC